MGDILGIPIADILRITAVVVLLLLVREAWKAVRQHGVAVFFSVVLAFVFFFVLFALLLAGLDQLPQGGDRLVGGFENVLGWITGGSTAGSVNPPAQQATAVPVGPTFTPTPLWPPAADLSWPLGGLGINIPKNWAVLSEPFPGADAPPGVFPLQVLDRVVDCAENWPEAVGKIRGLFGLGFDVVVYYEPNTSTCDGYNLMPMPPAAAPPQQAPAQPTAAGTTQYTVQTGDTLSRIAQRYGVTQAAILAANPEVTNANRIYPGQVLQIPAP